MKSIKKGALSRSLSLAKLGLRTGAKAASNYISGGEQDEYLVQQMKLISNEFGELKGTMMKMGQSLSMYGEHFLPPKANAYLKQLQFQSPPMDWEAIEAVIEKELGLGVFSDLDIEEKALASASLGQVHKAVHKRTGEVFAMKVQYPGVADAIESDVRNLRRVFSMAKIIPTNLDLEEIFDEIKSMLYQETNYSIEKSWTETVYEDLKDDERFVVPKVIEAYSTSKILTTEFIPGVTVDSDEVLSLPQEERDYIGFSFLSHYLNELFIFKAVQTDPHLGNYRVQLQPDGKHKLVLFDFGAMRTVPDDFGENFKGLIISGAIEKSKERIAHYGKKLGYLFEDDPKALVDAYTDLCIMITEPFREEGGENYTEDGGYKWKHSDLPKRATKAGTQIAKNFKWRTPPKEAIFLDRKLGGAFIFLSVIDFQANLKEWIKSKLLD
jgi:predicted unusual protein kinase regulating ubiquinone biosynthesis (AarF/ABC1/UbiB family)